MTRKCNIQRLEHDPEKHALGDLIRGWKPVFGKDRAQTANLDVAPIQLNWINVQTKLSFVAGEEMLAVRVRLRRPVKRLLTEGSWLAGLVWVATTLGPALADSNRRTVDLVSFNIPAQTLTMALDAYGQATGRELFYDGALTLDRQSNAIRGVLSPDAALSDLLAGTGLGARTTGPSRITIEPTAHSFVASSKSVAGSSSDPYFANVQGAVIRTLCASEDTRPGRSDTIVRMWVGSTGKVMRAQAVEPGSGVSLVAYENALTGLALGVPPPTVPQPIVLAVLARPPEQPNGCNESLH